MKRGSGDDGTRSDIKGQKEITVKTRRLRHCGDDGCWCNPGSTDSPVLVEWSYFSDSAFVTKARSSDGVILIYQGQYWRTRRDRKPPAPRDRTRRRRRS